MKSNYIVYGLLDINNIPFYIGMGVLNRPQQHFKESQREFNKHSNKQKLYKIKKILKITGKYPKVKIYNKGLSQKKAYQLEIKLITKIGINNLTNLKNGGKGGFFNNWNKELINKSISKMKETKKKMYKNGLLIPWNKGLTKKLDKRLEEAGKLGGNTRKRLGSNKGKNHGLYGRIGKEHPAFNYKHSKRAKDNISKSRMGLKNHNSKKCKIFTPDNKIYITYVNEFIRLYGKIYNVNAYFVRKLINKKKDGWKIIYI